MRITFNGATHKKPQQTFIVHGEDDASASLADALRT